VTPIPSPAASSLVSVADGVTSPDAAGIQWSFDTYFSAINGGDWLGAWSQFTRSEQSAVSLRKLAQGDETSEDSDIVIGDITSQPGGWDVVSVTFTSTQAPVDSPNGRACDRWILDYTMVPSSNGWLIGGVRVPGGAPYIAC
jgi:hypothetical protein